MRQDQRSGVTGLSVLRFGLLAVAVAAGLGAGQEVRPGAQPQWVTPAMRGPRLEHRTFQSAAVGGPVSYHIYTPEAYDKEPERRFPVLYWLHGTGGSGAGVTPLATRFDAAMRAGTVPPMIVVFPNGLKAGMWVDSKDGRTPVETVVIKELLPNIDATFRTIASREGRIIEGFSMGGYGAARLGFKHRDLFSAISILSGGPLQREFTTAPRAKMASRDRVMRVVYGDDHGYFQAVSPWVLAERNAEALRAGMPIRVVIGERDEMLAIVREFHQHLERLKIPHTFTVVPGVGHQPMAVLEGLGDAYWEFHRASFGSVVMTAE